MNSLISRPISIAPMMQYTDRHFRYLIRCISKHVFLFTEMINSAAIVNGDHKNLLRFNHVEHPIGVQLGGRDVKELLEASHIARDYGYDEINLNIGCPSKAVQKGEFGAKLMLQKEHVADIVLALSSNSKLPISVKCRLGVDQYDSYEFLYNFVNTVSLAGCKIFYVHARKALLNGISPKNNRCIPKLEYDKVYRLKKDFPNLLFILNGGIQSLRSYKDTMSLVDGIMIGRAAYREPYLLSSADNLLNNSLKPEKSIQEIACEYLDYADNQKSQKYFHITKHMQGLWYRKPNAVKFRRLVTDPKGKIDDIRDFVLSSI